MITETIHYEVSFPPSFLLHYLSEKRNLLLLLPKRAVTQQYDEASPCLKLSQESYF